MKKKGKMLVLVRIMVLGCLLLGSGWMLGCQSPAGQSGESPLADRRGKSGEASTTIKQQEDTLHYEYRTFRLTSTFGFPEDTLKEASDSTLYLANYPAFENETLQAFVMKSQLGTDTSSFQKAAQTFINEYDQFQATFPLPRPWHHETTTKVIQITGTYLGLQTDHYQYMGGAHGNYNTLFTHFWVPEQRELAYPDLIDTSQLKTLLPIAEQYFWAQEKERDQELSLDLYFFDNDQFYLPENIAFERDSVLFLYNIYEIKPYVYGQTELRIPYAEISPFLTEKARTLIKKIKEK